jgi:hypothetical protein
MARLRCFRVMDRFAGTIDLNGWRNRCARSPHSRARSPERSPGRVRRGPRRRASAEGDGRKRLRPHLPALKRAHRRVRARSAVGADGPMVKNRCMTASVGKTFGSSNSSGRTSTRVAGIAFG